MPPLLAAVQLYTATAPGPTIFEIVPSEIIVSIISLASGGIVAVLGTWAVLRKARVDTHAAERAADQAENTTLMATIRAELTRVSDKQTVSDAVNETLRIERDAARMQARDADDTVRDFRETLTDFDQWAHATDQHYVAGNPPPSPPITWRMDAWRRTQEERRAARNNPKEH